MSEVFAITGGYMQLISTIFSIITFLSNKIDHEVKIVNSIFNFYPNKKKFHSSINYKNFLLVMICTTTIIILFQK
jgi:hypothetical protein